MVDRVDLSPSRVEGRYLTLKYVEEDDQRGYEMSSLFRRKERTSREIRAPVIIPARTAEEEGFSFEQLTTATADECADAMMKAMPQVKWNREALKQSILAPNALTLMSRHEGAIVGVISGTVIPAANIPPTIILMAILDQASGERGLGGYLVDEFTKAAQKRAPKATFVDVSLPTYDTGSIALYSIKGFMIEGFVKDGFRTNFTGQGTSDLVVLRRRLTAPSPSSVV